MVLIIVFCPKTRLKDFHSYAVEIVQNERLVKGLNVKNDDEKLGNTSFPGYEKGILMIVLFPSKSTPTQYFLYV